ncbi:MAG: hypothetical protein AAGK05_13175 [Pseudomonadota bacterium]
MPGCACEECETKRGQIAPIMEYLGSGKLGKHKGKINNNLKQRIPKEFNKNLQSLLINMRKSDAGKYLNDNQREFFKSYKRVLSNFVKPTTHARTMLAQKRRYLSQKRPMAEGLGKVYVENPQLFQRFLKEMKLCSTPETK